MQLPTSKIKKFLFDLFFPRNCLGCKQPDTYLCRDCFNKIPLAANNGCFFCEKITGQGRVCLNCKKDTYLDRVISATEYKEPLTRELIKAFKYHFVTELSEPLAQLLIRTIEANFLLSTDKSQFLIIPIPLHRHRLRYRGFNQAELIAQELAKHFHLPVDIEILQRRIAKAPQAKISDTEKRKLNLIDVFALNSEVKNKLKGKTILLIDDVITTGATLSEAAKILRQNGAKEVWALTIAKG